MDYPTRSEWQIRCAFNKFCKQTLKNEAINAHNHIKWRQTKEVSLSSLTPEEENRLYACDRYFADDPAEQSFFVGAGKLRQGSLQTRYTACRRKSATPYCFITSTV